MIKLYCEYLYVRCIWLYVVTMSRTRFKVSRHFVVAWISRNFFLEACVKPEALVIATGLEPTTNLSVKEQPNL